jgi:Peptidase family M1 domain
VTMGSLRLAVLASVLVLSVSGLTFITSARAVPGEDGCSPGARTLSPPGSLLYPETGNGGYRSVHTGVHLVYDAPANRFLPGTQVVLTDLAAQCLSSFSLDFERRSVNRAAGPDLSVSSVRVNGQRARFAFAQPAYPGDPRGPGDPNPAAHEMSQANPVGGPRHNPLPPACTPELTTTGASLHSRDGEQCPADKLVITPAAAIPDGARFTVTVSYTGRPGVHNDADGTAEGWFRAPGGGFVATEPVGTEDWQPLNDYPSAKPSYDFYDTVNEGRTAVANGQLLSVSHHPPGPRFPHGSVTWHWRSGAPVASYLVENSIGDYRLSWHTGPGGVRYYLAQDAGIPAAQRHANAGVAARLPAVTALESAFTGTYPFRSDGVIVGLPPASFAEEMQTMIAFGGGTMQLGILYHENFHQWWGDNVSEAGYRMTFYKEGLATLAEYLMGAAQPGGRPSLAALGDITGTLISRFNAVYASGGGFWTTAPADPAPADLFQGDAIYARPAAAYIALRQILGAARFGSALRAIQRAYGGRSITQPGLAAAFTRWLPSQRPACRQRLADFFRQWFDTAYPPGGGGGRPRLTGPGLAGPGFYGGGCPAP